MNVNTIIQPSIWADYTDQQTNPVFRRGRFIAPSADLSALGAFPAIPMKKLICIIAPTADYAHEQNDPGIRTGASPVILSAPLSC
jgi:hypothetical protein